MKKKYTTCYFQILNYDRKNINVLKDKYNFYSFKNPNSVKHDIKKKINILFAPLGYQFNENTLKEYTNLKVICSNTTGHPHIDLGFAELNKIKVICLKFYPDFLKTITPTAEFTFTLGLSLYRNIFKANLSLRKEFKWDRTLYPAQYMLNRLKIGIVGLGRIGSMLRDYFNFFKSEVFFYDPYVHDNYGTSNKIDDLKKLMQISDIVFLCAPHEKNTENLISSDVIMNFKKGSFFINTARAELVDWEALIYALREKRILGVASDVFPNEYSDNFKKTFCDHPLYKEFISNDNIVLTPHIAGSTKDAWFLTQKKVVDELNYYLEGINDKKI